MNKKWTQTMAMGLGVIGICATLFNSFSDVAKASELSGVEVIANGYQEMRLQNPQDTLPKGYEKANYTVTLDTASKEQPTSKDLTKEEAAEKGAMALWEVFGFSMEGKSVEMYYYTNSTSKRAEWMGNVIVKGLPDFNGYSFSVDAITGELLSVVQTRTLKENVALGYDSKLAKNIGEYEALAKQVAKQYNVVQGEVKSVEYDCQGYQSNDPDICFQVTGENGEVAQIMFSRYDKALLAIVYPKAFKEILKENELLNEKMENYKQKNTETASFDQKQQNSELNVIDFSS